MYLTDHVNYIRCMEIMYIDRDILSAEGIDGFILKPIFNIYVEACAYLLKALAQGKAWDHSAPN